MRQHNNIWNREMECLEKKDLRRLQLQRLQQTVERVYANVAAYRRLFDEKGLKPSDIKSLEDIRLLPFTTKTLLRDNYPYGLFAVPMRQIIRLHASSGTTGKPTVVGYTRNDLEVWSEVIARMATSAGVVPDDIAQVTFGYGLFTGAFGLHYGLEKVGAAVVPSSAGNTEKQLQLMQDFGTTVLIGTPSYALHMADVAQSMGLDPTGMKMRLGLFGSEVWTEEIRKKLEEKWNITATDNYGLSEIIGPGVAGECTHCRGYMHVNEDHFFVEVIDPETGEPVEYGQKGELVITTLTKEALPLLRYRTRDYTIMTDEPCACGRTTARMTKVVGRSDDMLIVSGVNVFPSQIESVLVNIKGLQPYYQIVLAKKGHLDHIEVQVELAQEYFVDDYCELERLEELVKHKLFNVLSIRPHVKLLKPNSLERRVGKAVRVVDQRNG